MCNDPQQHSSLCEPLVAYSRRCQDLSLFALDVDEAREGDVRVIELFAGVGGFRIGLERASERFKTVWSNQWEPATKRQDASLVYTREFGMEGHSNQDINTVRLRGIAQMGLRRFKKTKTACTSGQLVVILHSELLRPADTWPRAMTTT